MKNRFWNIALVQASRLAGKPGRMITLVTQLLHRIYTMDKAAISIKSMKERLFVLGRLVKSYARGDYREVPLKTLLIVLAAVIYFLNPVDLIPDFLFGIGLTDDLAVLTWVYASASNEIKKFEEWESLVSGSSTITH